MIKKEASPAPKTTATLLAEVVSAGSLAAVSRFLIETAIARTTATDPELARLVRLGAIPRRLDAGIVGVLRNRPEDLADNQGLLEKLRRFSFVRPRTDGGLIYHESIREVLLAEWRAGAKADGSFDEVNGRLVEYYERELDSARQLADDLNQVAQIVRRASPKRYVQIASALNARFITSLIETLYHEALRDAEAGFGLFVRDYHECEEQGRLSVCRALVDSAREWLADSASEAGASRANWLDFYDARLRSRLGRLDEVVQLLTSLHERVGSDAKLEMWVLSELGLALRKQNRLREARKALEQGLEVAEATHVDPYNLPSSYSQLAWLCWWMDDLNGAIARYRDALRAARDERTHNPHIEIDSLLSIAALLAERGLRGEALDAGLEALDVARAEWAGVPAFQGLVAEGLMHVMTMVDPTLLDTLFSEAEALQAAAADSDQALDLRLRYAKLLVEAGLLGRAGSVLPTLRHRRGRRQNGAFEVKLLMAEAALEEQLGRLDSAVEKFERVAQLTSGRAELAWESASAILDSGITLSRLSSLARAEAAVMEAAHRWEEIGASGHAAAATLALVTIRRRQGRLEEAAAILDREEEGLSDATLALVATARQERGDLEHLRGRWAESAIGFERTAGAWLQLGLNRRAAAAVLARAYVAAEAGDGKLAFSFAEEASRLLAWAAQTEAFAASRASAEADQQNAQGLRRLRSK